MTPRDRNLVETVKLLGNAARKISRISTLAPSPAQSLAQRHDHYLGTSCRWAFPTPRPANAFM